MRTFATAVLTAFLVAAPVHALTAKQTVEKENIVRNADGSETRVRVPAETVTPGERVIYTVSFTNDQAQPAANFVMTQPVPEEIVFVEGSADKPGAEVTVSADGGQTFTSREAATVLRGETRVRASAEDITHVRWKITEPLAPGASDKVSYRGILK